VQRGVSDDLIKFGPHVYCVSWSSPMVLKPARLAFLFTLVFSSGCTNTNASTLQLDASYFASTDGGEISLVSLVFPREDGVKSVKATDLISGNPVRFDFVETENRMVVTLKLRKDLFANPQLIFDGKRSFTALLTPDHSLSTFDGLMFSKHTVFLRDHGVERVLKPGENLEIPSGELTRLWIGERFVNGARVYLSPEKGEGLKLLAHGSEVAVVKNGEELITNFSNLTLSGGEGITLVASPKPGADTIHLSIVAD